MVAWVADLGGKLRAIPLHLCIIDGIVTEVLEGGLGDQAGRRRGYELRGQGAAVPNRGSRLGL